MRDERLYIDGELTDIDSGTKITLNFKSNLFRDASKIASNSTYSVKLPKTSRNLMIFQHSDLLQSKGSFAYRTHAVRYFRNGAEIIKDGRAAVLQITEDAIELSILWGLFAKFSALLSAGTTLNQLESDDRILYEAKNKIAEYDEVLTKGYFYAYYDVWTKENTTDYSWESGYGMIYPEEGAETLTRQSEGRRGGRNGDLIENLHPVVRVSWILGLVKKIKGVDFQFEGEAKEKIDSLVLPLISRKSNELTFDKSFRAKLCPTDDRGMLNLSEMESSSVFSIETGSEGDVIKAKRDANVIIDVKGEWRFDLTGAKRSGSGSYFQGGKRYDYDDYSFRSGYYLKITVNTGSEKQEYFIGKDRGRFLVRVQRGYQGLVKYRYSGVGKVQVKNGSTITFEWLSEMIFRDVQFAGGEVKAMLQSEDYVPNGGYFPITANLPKVKVLDLVKFLAVITGTFPLQMSKDGVVRFVSLSAIWNKRGGARDWTNRIVSGKGENKPRSLEFVLSDYGQHNLYKWKEDEKVVGNYDGELVIENQTLEHSKTIFEFPFSATDGNSIPMYTKDKTSAGGFEGPSPEEKKPSYSACKDRVLTLVKDDKGKAVTQFDINMQKIIDEKYHNISDSLQKAKIITERIRMRDLELINFDETRPIYLAQYGGYFAVLDIKADDSGIAEVTMLQLYFS